MEEKIRRIFSNYIHDMFMDIFYYDRKEDREVGLTVIEEYLKSGIISLDEIVDDFREQLKKGAGIR